ncbi:hypothetical protein AVEN_267832-1 [Araneus ventricosus]|uniref:DUF4817 domain-containing protein n=1 Tax=Araneus ventricosus TaxID=182803 RepID=A0A4Y2D3M3_ARAVE|nr:hypothetical protein AVEN_267832-1 [Araneus ventricosus]
MRRCPHHTTFATIDRLPRETGTFHPAQRDAGTQRNKRTPQMEETVLQRFADSPSKSTRAVAAELDAQHTAVWNVLHAEKMYPFHIHTVQLLTEDDYLHREQFVSWMLAVTTHSNPQFPATVLFTDEASFTREGIVNTHNAHMWAMDNPHASVLWKSQQRFSVNVWAVILGDYLLGPYLLPELLNEARYLVFLQHVLAELLQSMPATVQRGMWFMHDGVLHIFPARCVITSMLHTGSGLDARDPLLGLHVRRIVIRVPFSYAVTLNHSFMH